MFTKRIIQFAIGIGLIAFILSTSRIFLTIGERTGNSDFYIYNLNHSGPLSAFVSIIIISILAIIIGIFLNRQYDIVGLPLQAGGTLTLAFITLINYINISIDKGADNTLSNIILLAIFSIELISLIILAEIKLPNLPKKEPITLNPINTNPIETDPTGIKNQ